PAVTILPQKTNLGFSDGNNQGIRWAIAHGCDYVFLHNGDGFLEAGSLEPLVAAMEGDAKIGVAQSLLVMYPETDLINTSGNLFHFLGFGYCDNYRTPVRSVRFPAQTDISYASGAAVLMRVSLLKEFGLWDEDFFLYHEDCEYSFRLRLAGYRIVLIPASIFYHKYQFSRSIEKFYWMERNRFAILLMFFRWPTLLLLLPMIMALELGLWFFAWQHGWLNKRLVVYRYWLSPDNVAIWLCKRRAVQARRVVGDRYLLRFAVPGIHFQEKAMESRILRYIGNPFMKLYYWVVIKGLIWW
ncbi:MAG: glycosyltransferase family 2 protein, partial [Candidatus Magasanikbacteria bacterium]|nr:glycosyltransferase family 2 protein [Candidatus Magasanikbacteria bacterium]